MGFNRPPLPLPPLPLPGTTTALVISRPPARLRETGDRETRETSGVIGSFRLVLHDEELVLAVLSVRAAPSATATAQSDTPTSSASTTSFLAVIDARRPPSVGASHHVSRTMRKRIVSSPIRSFDEGVALRRSSARDDRILGHPFERRRRRSPGRWTPPAHPTASVTAAATRFIASKVGEPLLALGRRRRLDGPRVRLLRVCAARVLGAS